jgi:hydroxypyruvate isomerase
MSDELHIERLGGLAGMGLPSSRLRSEGRVASEGLSAADRQAVDHLFTTKPRAAAASRSRGAVRDGFRYRITRTAADGTQVVVEVADEAQVPRVLLDSIRDEWR